MRELGTTAKRLVGGLLSIALVGALSVVLTGGRSAPAVGAASSPRYAPGPGENESLTTVERYWTDRVTYPTGVFNMRWLLQAARQDRLIRSAVPAGAKTYSRSAESPLALNPAAFTSLGPKPEQEAPWGHVSGRVNAIAIDPVETAVAYIGPVGGGVWKTTNCCTAATTWTPVTDQPAINSTSIDDIVIDPNDHNTVYAATGDLNFGSFAMGSAGILKSTDQGATWQVLGENVFAPVYPPAATPTFPQYQAVGKVRVDPNDSDVVIAGTKTGLYFSYNGGTDWTGPCLPDSFTGQRHDVTGLLTRDNAGTTALYAAIGTRGYATTVQPDLGNNGANGIYLTQVPASGCPAAWQLLSTEAKGWPHGTGGGIGCNPPIGTLANCPSPDANLVGRIDLAMAPSNPDVIYAEVQSINVQSSCSSFQARGCLLGLWRTTDGGTSWTKQAATRNTNGCGGSGGTSDSAQNWYNQGLAVSPASSNTLYVNMIDVWRSADGGGTIFDVACSYGSGSAAKTHPDQHPLAFVPGSSTTMLAGNDGGIWLITNADTTTPTFTQLNDSLSTIEFYSGDISGNFATSATPVAVGGAQDNGSSTVSWGGGNPGPALWTQRNGGDGLFGRIEQKAGLRVFLESQWGALVRSTTGHAGGYGGASGAWGAGSATQVDRKSFIFPYEIDRFDCTTNNAAATCDHMIAGTYRVWESVNGGGGSSAWLPNSPDLTKSDPTGTTGLADRAFVNALQYGYGDNTKAIAGTNDGNVWYGFGLGQGVAGSATWVNVSGANAVLPNRPILDVVTGTNPLVGYASVGGFDENTATTTGHVFQVTCTAGCASFTWLNKTGNLPNVPADSVVVNPNVPNQVFVGTDWGLYFTNDISVTSPIWFRFDSGLPHVMIWDLAVDRGATTLAVFTRGRGAYAWPLSGQTPTALSTSSFAGRVVGAGVRLSWRTAVEANVIGYDVFRFAHGKGSKVNRKLIAARAAGRPSGAAYSVVDRSVRRGTAYTYRLQAVRRSGARDWIAQAAVRVR